MAVYVRSIWCYIVYDVIQYMALRSIWGYMYVVYVLYGCTWSKYHIAIATYSSIAPARIQSLVFLLHGRVFVFTLPIAC